MAGGAVADLSLGDRKVFLIGYGPGNSRKTKLTPGALRLRALVLKDDAGAKIALVSGDFWAGSGRVLLHIGSLLREQHAALGFDDAQVFFSGTHTHCSIAEIYESPYYSTFAGSWPHDAGFDDALAKNVARQLVDVIVRAHGALAPAALSVGEANFSGSSINRSYPAFVKNQVLGTDPDPDADETAQRAVINPKVRLLRVTDTATGQLIGAWGSVTCHATALGRNFTDCHADFLGTASAELEGSGPVRAPWVLCAGTEGDVDPQPGGLSREQFVADRATGPALSLQHLATLAGALKSSVQAATWGAAKSDIKLSALRTYALASNAPVQGGRLPKHPRVGDPVLRGSELARGPCSEEGARDEHQSDNPHKPKVSLNPATAIINGAMHDHAPYLPLSVFKLGDLLWLVGLPGEPTTTMGHSVEARLAPHAGVTPVMVCGVSGGYNGYLTTEAEYEAQHYEGASCIWGRFTQRFILERLETLVSGAKATPANERASHKRYGRAVATAIERGRKAKQQASLNAFKLVSVHRTAETIEAELEIELGPHLIRVRPTDHRPAAKNRWQLLFLIDKRLLKYRARLVHGNAAVLSQWRPLHGR